MGLLAWFLLTQNLDKLTNDNLLKLTFEIKDNNDRLKILFKKPAN